MTVNKGTQYEIEFTVTSPTGERHVNGMSLRSVREVLDVEFTRPGKALIGIRAVATSQLSGFIDVKVVREDRIINTFDGSVWTLEYSNNRAWIVWDILTLPSIDGNGDGTPFSIERYDGIDPSYLDLNFFYAWSLFCDEEILDGYGGTEARAACNIIVDAFTDTYSLAQRIAKVGRANVYWAGDKLTGWIDTVVTERIDLVTMDSMMAKSWRNNWAVVSELAGVVEVLYKDNRQGYEKTSADYSSEDAGGFRNIVSLEGVGMTSRGPVIHYAKHLVTRNKLIRNKNEFTVAKDGFRYDLGDVIRLQSRPANWGEAYRVMSFTTDTVTVDRDVTGDVSVGDVLHIRSYDNITEQVVTDTYEVDSISGRVITVIVNWDVDPAKGNLVAVGLAGDIKLRRIIKIQPTSDNYFKVIVEAYDVDLFDSDDIDPNNPNVNYIWAGASPGIGGAVTHAELDDLVAQIVPAQPNINVPWPANIDWTGSGGDAVAWSKVDADFDMTFRYAGTSNVIAEDSTTDKYIYWDPSSPTVFLSSNLLATAIGGGDHWVVAINEAGVVSTPNPQQIIHGGLIEAGTITAEFAQIAEATIGTLNVIDLNITNDKMANLTLETGKVKADAISIAASDYNESDQNISGSPDTVASATIGYTGAGFLSIQGSVMVRFDTVNSSAKILVKRAPGGVFQLTIYETPAVDIVAAVTGLTFAFVISDIPASGSTDYWLQVDAGANQIIAFNASIIVQELKK